MELNLFNSIIWKSKINYDKKYELIEIIKDNYERNPNQTPKDWKCVVHSTFKHKNNHIPQDLLELITNKSEEFLSVYKKKLKIDGTYYIKDIWYNAYKGNQFQEPHTHGGVLFSGCYYLKFDKNVHHQTTFYNPNFNINYSKLEDNSYFCFSPDCEEDDVIFFPSSLKHGTQGIKNSSDDMRITVSFNIANSSVCNKSQNKNLISYA